VRAVVVEKCCRADLLLLLISCLPGGKLFFFFLSTCPLTRVSLKRFKIVYNMVVNVNASSVSDDEHARDA